MSADKVVLADPHAIKALAHPARLAILEYLGDRDSATATECAEVVGLSPSATSYHLRALARFGLVTEAEGTDKRERRWRSLGGYATASERSDDTATRSATRLLGQLVLGRADDRARSYLARTEDEPADWWNAATFTEASTYLTVEQLQELNAAVAEVIDGYARRPADASPGARKVQVTYRAFPVTD